MQRHRISIACLAACCALLSALPAQGGLVGSPVTVTLISPNGLISAPDPISAMDAFASLAAGASITAGDSTSIGSFMQPGLTPDLNEHIIFSDSSVDIRVDAGYVDAATGAFGTGYAAGGEYLFSGFQLPGKQAISGATLSVQPGGVINFSPGWLTLVSPTSFSLDLGSMTFVQQAAGQSASGADFTIALSFAAAPVPEPSALVLAMAGISVLWIVCRRSA